MSAKADRRARKKARRALAPRRERCDYCGRPAPGKDGDHDTAWSRNGTTREGIAVVAFCQWCGSDTCS